MKNFRSLLAMFAVAAFVAAGPYGCVKKQEQAKETEKVEAQRPAQQDMGSRGVQAKPEPVQEAVKEESPVRKVEEAPPGPKEVVEQPTMAAEPEKKQALEDIHFDFDRFDIMPADKSILQDNAEWMKANSGKKVTIEGHCDERGTVEYNLSLGEKRAKEAMNYLVTLGVDSGRLNTISYGKSRPLDPGNDEGAWAKNRRDHFVAE